VATVKRASSTITNDTQKRGPRGYYLNKNIPKDPSERKPIHIIGPSEYLEACAAISIIKDFKAHFCGTQTEWSKLNDDFVDLLYQCFLDRYQYEETMDPKEARKVWVRRAMERCRGTWAMVRIKCEKKSRSSNKADWMNFCPEFVNVVTNWRKEQESKHEKFICLRGCIRKTKENSIGDPKKKNYYGYGITQDPEILHGHGTSVDSTPVNNEAIIEAQVIARVESRLEGVREEMRAEMRKMFEDQQKAMSSNNLVGDV
ncbi:hypothetical protein Tco_1027798, partial [Tanacetum coccineum]